MSPAPRPRILLADPQEHARSPLAEALRKEGFEVDAQRADEFDQEASWDVVLCDPGSGEGVLDDALALPGSPAVILLDGFGSIDDAVAAMRRGAFDYIAKPAPEDQVIVSVRRALDRRSLVEENRELRADLERRYELSNLISRDVHMQRVFATVRSIADTRANVLIEGESGTGKTMLARAIHLNSSRASEPFVVVNCGSVPGSLLESELFGHVRGAFTGAVRDRAGKFEVADRGTVFLDEIATASLDLQVKLLRVIESKRFERVGDSETREVDVRIVAAGNRRLEAEVADGRFREDLYYRLNVVAVEIPPLRERSGDVPLLAATFLERFRDEHGRDVNDFSRSALERLLSHDWPGNVRELENRIERAVLLAGGREIGPGDLGFEEQPDEPRPAAARANGGSPAIGPLKKALEGPERQIIVRALDLNAGNRQATARMLAINRTTLFNKMRKYDLLDYPSRSA